VGRRQGVGASAAGVWYGDSFVLLAEMTIMVVPASHGERLQR
jgi:hypothetical protein